MRFAFNMHHIFISLLLICLSTLSITLSAADSASKSNPLLPTINIEKGDKCVEPTDIMRTNHMEFILHQRDKTMHEGLRTKQHSLKNCINCHANPETNSVLGKDGFCESCHTYAAVSMDCFGCHSSAPEKELSNNTPSLSPSSSIEHFITLSAPLLAKEQTQ